MLITYIIFRQIRGDCEKILTHVCKFGIHCQFFIKEQLTLAPAGLVSARRRLSRPENEKLAPN